MAKRLLSVFWGKTAFGGAHGCVQLDMMYEAMKRSPSAKVTPVPFGICEPPMPIRFLSYCFWVCLLAVITLVEPTRAAIVINNYSDAANDRFANSGSFIASGFNLSGVGQASNGRWATAISRNVVISANHFIPTGAITFHVDNNPFGSTVVRNIVSGTQVAGTDLWLGVLNSSLPGSIVHYNYATQTLMGSPGALSNAGIYQGLDAYMFGRSPVAHPDTRDQAVGRNKISHYVENATFLNPNNDILELIRDTSAPNQLFHEAYLQVGDSGAPLFVNIAGEFRLLGTNAYIGSRTISGNTVQLSGVNYIGNKADDINGFVSSVPEPGSLALMFGASLVMLAHRRRSLRKVSVKRKWNGVDPNRRPVGLC